MSQTLIEQYQEMHKNPKRFCGMLQPEAIQEIAKFVQSFKSKTLLDYGSGKGRQYLELRQHDAWGGILPTCYDPGYQPFAARPAGKFDGVICTDVAEHIPEDELDAFLVDVMGYARQFVVFSIFTAPAKKTLPDGRNVHLTVHDGFWWNDRINALRPASRYGPLIAKVFRSGV